MTAPTRPRKARRLTPSQQLNANVAALVEARHGGNTMRAASAIGLPRAVLHRMMHAETTKLVVVEYLVQLAHHFGVTTDALLTSDLTGANGR